MPPATQPKKPSTFDLAVLEKMQEPIRIRVERFDRSTGGKMPISLPQDEWSKNDARNIENIVLRDIAGGGNYEAEMSDAAGKSFTWKFNFDERYFPSRIPALMEAAAVPMGYATPPPVTGGNGGGQPVAYMPGSYAAHQVMYPPPPPAGYRQPAYSTPVQQQQPQMGGYSYMNYPPYPFTPPASGDDATRRELEAVKRQAQEAEHRREREADQARHAAELAELRRAIENKSAANQPDPIQVMTLQMQQQQQLWERERAERADRETAENRRREDEQRRREEDRKREEDRWRTEMAERQRVEERREQAEERRRSEERVAREEQRRVEDQRRIDDQRRMDLMLSQQQNQHSPLFAMMDNLTRQLAESQREESRRASEAPMKSMEMARLFKEMGGGEHLLKNISGAYEGAHNVTMRGLEMMNQFMANQQGSPIPGLIADGMGQAKEVLTELLTAKQKAEIAKSKAEQAQAQERTMAYQAQAAYQHAQAAQQQAAAAPHDEIAARRAEQAAQAAETQAAQAAQASVAAKKAETEVETAETKKAAQEEKLFGLAYKDVITLRQWVKQVGENAETTDDVARGIVAGAIQVKQAGIKIPAFDLFAEQRYADLIEHVIPAGSSDFVGKTVERIRIWLAAVQTHGPEVLNQQPEGGGEDAGKGGDDDDDDDDDDAEEDGEEGGAG